MKHRAPKTDEYKRVYTERLLSGISAANQHAVREYLRDKEGTDRNKSSSLMNQAIVLSSFDRYLNGGRITDATPELVRDYLLMIAKRAEPTTEWMHCSLVKAYLRVHYRGNLPYE